MSLFQIIVTLILIFSIQAFHLEKFTKNKLKTEERIGILFLKSVEMKHVFVLQKLASKIPDYNFYFSTDKSLLTQLAPTVKQFPTIVFIKTKPDQTVLVIPREVKFKFAKIWKWIKSTNLLSEKKTVLVQKKEPIVELDKSSFSEVVYGKGTDVFLKIYAPWCQHCLDSENTYQNVGKFFENVKNLIIARIDGDKWKKHMDIKNIGFPTSLFFPKGDKKHPIVFKTDRTENNFVQFLKKHAIASKNEIKNMKWTIRWEKDEL
jgi:thiol-disulfide isomerase/thioredoxin